MRRLKAFLLFALFILASLDPRGASADTVKKRVEAAEQKVADAKTLANGCCEPQTKLLDEHLVTLKKTAMKLEKTTEPDQIQLQIRFFDQDLQTLDALVNVLMEAREKHDQKLMLIGGGAGVVVIGLIVGGIVLARRRKPTGAPVPGAR